MATQTATTGNLDDAQGIIIAKVRYTAEANDPCHLLIENFRLPKGEKQMTVPKVGAMTAQNLTDGVDMVDSEDIGLTSTDLTTSEVGLKIILTDKLIHQFNEDVFRVIGRQGGDAMSRKMDEDIIALFSALNGGTAIGKDGATLGLQQASACVARATAEKYPRPVYFVHHPYAIATLARNSAGIGATYFAGVIGGVDSEQEKLLRNFWKINVDGVNFFQDGNIAKVSSVDSGYGAIFSKAAMCIIKGWDVRSERERDASLRAWELVITADYGCFELDDSYGAPAQYEMGALETS